MGPEIIEHWLVLVRMLSEVKAELKHSATKEYVLEKNQIHAAECPAAKKHRLLVLIGALLSGGGFLGGIIISKLMN